MERMCVNGDKHVYSKQRSSICRRPNVDPHSSPLISPSGTLWEIGTEGEERKSGDKG